MANDNILIENREIKSIFLLNKEIPKEYKLPDDIIPFGYIYCIENILNGKKYIGSVYSVWTGCKPSPVVQLGKRASNYIYEYRHLLKDLKSNKVKRYTRPILRAMVEYDIRNFRMYPIAETERHNHFQAERFFMEKLNTVENGYNSVKVYSNTKFRSIFNKHTAASKKLRSEPIICINLNLKKIIFSDSMKLFGDYMNSTKDMIKNSARSGKPYKGWFVFYTTDAKRNDILYKYINATYGVPKSKRYIRYENSKLFYKDLCNTISAYLKSEKPHEYFQDFEILDPLEYIDDSDN